MQVHVCNSLIPRCSMFHVQHLNVLCQTHFQFTYLCASPLLSPPSPMHPQGLHVLDIVNAPICPPVSVVSYQNLPDGVPIDEAKDQEQGKYRPLPHPGMVFHWNVCMKGYKTLGNKAWGLATANSYIGTVKEYIPLPSPVSNVAHTTLPLVSLLSSFWVVTACTHWH